MIPSPYAPATAALGPYLSTLICDVERLVNIPPPFEDLTFAARD
jgi:hypothetical protein